MKRKIFDDVFDKVETTLYTRAGKHKDWAMLYGLKYAFEKCRNVNIIFNEKIYRVDINKIINIVEQTAKEIGLHYYDNIDKYE